MLEVTQRFVYRGSTTMTCEKCVVTMAREGRMPNLIPRSRTHGHIVFTLDEAYALGRRTGCLFPFGPGGLPPLASTRNCTRGPCHLFYFAIASLFSLGAFTFSLLRIVSQEVQEALSFCRSTLVFRSDPRVFVTSLRILLKVVSPRDLY